MSSWSVKIEGASNVTSTLTLPAEVNRLHVVEYISCSLVCDNVAPTAINKVYLRNGLVNVGSILWSKSLITPARSGVYFDLPVYFVGSINTAISFAFLLPPGINNVQDLSMSGQTYNTL